MKCKYVWINEMQLLSSSFYILIHIHILNDEGKSFLTFVWRALFPCEDEREMGLNRRKQSRLFLDIRTKSFNWFKSK
jgi:hypothetical protein